MVAPAQHLDATDRVLIRELIRDGRVTYAKLAPLVGLSQASVRSRVKRLIDERLIVVTGRVDPATFGLGVFAFAFVEVNREVDKTAALIGEVDSAVFVVIGTGRFDLLVELRCGDQHQLLDALDRLRVIEGVARVQSATVLHYDKQDWTGVGQRQSKPQPAAALPSPKVLEDIDRALLSELIADGRVSYAALARLVGLSQAAVRERVIDLIGSRVIAIAAHPVPEAMGIAGFAAVAIRVHAPVAPIVSAMVALAETTLVARTLGRFDVLAEIWFEDYDHLAEVLEILRDLPQVASVDTAPYLRIAKEEFGSGFRP